MKKLFSFAFAIILFSKLYAQNVGIGTTNPLKPLHINGSGEVLRIQGSFPWVGFMNNSDPDYGGFLYYPDTSLVMGSRFGTNLPLIIAPNNLGLLYATASQNIGIGNAAPAEKLDVNGNINVTGTIKANGTDGTAGQVLMKNSSGNLTWGDFSEYKKVHTISAAGAGSWTVPASVTKIMVEVVGGGGGGNINGGGGGGGYVVAFLDVTPASTVNYTVGTGGSGGAGANGTNGGISSLTYGGIGFNAIGGGGAIFDNTLKQFSAAVGQYTVTPATFYSYYAEYGGVGKPNRITFQQKSATSFYEISSDGNGGGPGYCRDCESEGTYILYDIAGAATVRWSNASGFKPAGTGGGGGYLLTSVGGFVGGAGGAPGLIRIHY